MLGVLLMTLEYLETCGQKVLQLGIAGVGIRTVSSALFTVLW